MVVGWGLGAPTAHARAHVRGTPWHRSQGPRLEHPPRRHRAQQGRRPRRRARRGMGYRGAGLSRRRGRPVLTAWGKVGGQVHELRDHAPSSWAVAGGLAGTTLASVRVRGWRMLARFVLALPGCGGTNHGGPVELEVPKVRSQSSEEAVLDSQEAGRRAAAASASDGSAPLRPLPRVTPARQLIPKRKKDALYLSRASADLRLQHSLWKCGRQWYARGHGGPCAAPERAQLHRRLPPGGHGGCFGGGPGSTPRHVLARLLPQQEAHGIQCGARAGLSGVLVSGGSVKGSEELRHDDWAALLSHEEADMVVQDVYGPRPFPDSQGMAHAGGEATRPHLGRCFLVIKGPGRGRMAKEKKESTKDRDAPRIANYDPVQKIEQWKKRVDREEKALCKHMGAIPEQDPPRPGRDAPRTAGSAALAGSGPPATPRSARGRSTADAARSILRTPRLNTTSSVGAASEARALSAFSGGASSITTRLLQAELEQEMVRRIEAEDRLRQLELRLGAAGPAWPPPGSPARPLG
ncbi:unnamed protein product [Prorocentrum cordatum]|uniref:Ribosome biogenesis protein NOP53 n=1 Tax=Prorocentrum cordatum TaxID=2364126 RepID=A0ABN9VBS9_9DINO|nr:unnamed protein product [Polarella glacialis]